MQKVTSKDGTTIAYERHGDGEPLVLVYGATCDRAFTRPHAEGLARALPVLNYDRRGRGDSGDVGPYAVEREIEDIAALVEAAGGAPALYGHSSGCALVLRAAAEGLPVSRIVLHEPPYGPDSEDDRAGARAYARDLAALLADGHHDDAVALFMQSTGMPDEMLDEVRRGEGWARLAALAPTLAYDSMAMGDLERGGVVPRDVAAGVAVPALVVSGGDSPEWMIDTARSLADAIPAGTHRVLPGEGHVVEPEVLAPVLVDFLRP